MASIIATLLVIAGPPTCERVALAAGPSEPAIAAMLREHQASGAEPSSYETIPPRAPVEATASSFQTWRDKRYRPANVFDRDFETAWVENDEADGIGQWVAGKLRLPPGLEARGLILIPGFAKNAHMFGRNNLPRRLLLELRCNRIEVRCRLEPLDRRTAQLFLLPAGQRGRGDCRLVLTVEAVRRGSHYRDTSIAEARLVASRTPSK